VLRSRRPPPRLCSGYTHDIVPRKPFDSHRFHCSLRTANVDLATCERVGPDTFRFVSRERAAGPVSMVARYTARYEGNGVDRIRFESLPVEGDNTDVSGTIVLERTAEKGTRVRLTQTIAPDTPRPPPRAGSDPVLRTERSGLGRAWLPRQRPAGDGDDVTRGGAYRIRLPKVCSRLSVPR
jgi:hypothetical protein